MSGRPGPRLETGPEKPGQGQKWRSRLLGSALSVAANLVVFAALFWPHVVPRPPSPPQASPPDLQISLIEAPRPKPPAPSKPVELQVIAAAPRVEMPKLPRMTAPRPAAVMTAPVTDNSDLLSESQLAGAAGTGEGSGGGSCDIAQLLQRSLRRDPLVRAAVEDAHRTGKAVMLWNGDWVRSGGQDGKGLSAVREAIMWEVAFAPEACRNQRVHGLVLLSLADGNTRFAIGSGDWRWSDLLYARGVGAIR